jgi:hypothetical protein
MTAFQKIYGRVFLVTLAVMVFAWSASWACFRMSGELGGFPRGLFMAAGAHHGSGEGSGLTEVHETRELIFEGLETLSIRTLATDVHVVIDSKPTPAGKPAMAELTLKGRAPELIKNGRKRERLAAIRNGADFQVVVEDAIGTDSVFNWQNLMGHVSFDSDYETGLTLEVKLPASFKGKLQFKTTSGDLSLKGATLQGLSVEGVSSDLKLESVALHEAKIQTTSGDVDLEGRVDRLQAETVSGDVQVEFDPAQAKALERLEIETTSGDVTAYISENLDARIQVSSVSGEITTDIQPLIAAGFTEKPSAEAQLGAGRGEVRFKTVSGDISILRHDALN